MDSSLGAIAAIVPEDHRRSGRKSSDRDSDEVLVVHSSSSTVLPSPPPKFKRPSILKQSGAATRSPVAPSTANQRNNGCLNRSPENCTVNGMISSHLQRNLRRVRSVSQAQSGSSLDQQESSRTPSPTMRETRSMSAAEIFDSNRNAVESDKCSGSHDDLGSAGSISEKNAWTNTKKASGKKLKRSHHSSGSSNEFLETASKSQKSEETQSKKSSKKRNQKKQKLKIEVDADSEDEKLIKRFIKKPKPSVSTDEFQVPLVKPISLKTHGKNSKTTEALKYRVENPTGFSNMIKRFEDSHANRAQVPKHGFLKPTAWICAFCFCRSNEHNLGDLFGPYFVSATALKASVAIFSNLTDEDQAAHEKFINRICRSKARQKSAQAQTESDAETSPKSPSKSKSKAAQSFCDIWLHGPCMLWCQGLQMQGKELQGLPDCLTEAWTQARNSIFSFLSSFFFLMDFIYSFRISPSFPFIFANLFSAFNRITINFKIKFKLET